MSSGPFVCTHQSTLGSGAGDATVLDRDLWGRWGQHICLIPQSLSPTCPVPWRVDNQNLFLGCLAPCPGKDLQLPVPIPGAGPEEDLSPASSTKAGEVLDKVHISKHGVPMCLPTKAPQCPFSGLSLTTATACPMLPLGFMSSPGSLMLS